MVPLFFISARIKNRSTYAHQASSIPLASSNSSGIPNAKIKAFRMTFWNLLWNILDKKAWSQILKIWKRSSYGLSIYVPNTTYILDGLDALNPKDAKSILRCIRLFFCGSTNNMDCKLWCLAEMRFPDTLTCLLHTRNLPDFTSFNNMKDIKNYIKQNNGQNTRQKTYQ